MEFKLNKIDRELRREVNEKTKEDKVHTKDEIFISKDLKKENKNKVSYCKLNNKKKIVVDAEQKLDDVEKNTHRGLLIDKKT